jgi:hypothetical protein
VFESMDEIGHFAHIRNLWIIRQQFEHFLYPKTKVELAHENYLYNKGFTRKCRLRGHQTCNGWGLTGIEETRRLLSSYR